jgi:hypothetical protein
LNVLSLFDGISIGQLAFKELGIKIDNYFASEIKPNAIKVTKQHFPDTIHIGDVTKVRYENGVLHTEKGSYEVKIDMIIGGSPCQDFSPLKWINWYSAGLEGDKSKLFYEYLRIVNEVNPKYFFLENVKMKQDSEWQLNKHLNTQGIHVNSSLVSYQNRPRIYWTSIPGVTVPADRNINFQDYKDTDYDYCKQFKVNRTPSRERMWNGGNGRNSHSQGCANITHAEKVYCVTRKQDRAPNSGLIEFEDFCRYLTRKEIEQAQTLPIGYTDCLSYNQMQDVCGDSWTLEVIKHFFSFIKEGKLINGC